MNHRSSQMTVVWLRTTCRRGAQTANYSASSKMVKDIKEYLKQLERLGYMFFISRVSERF